MDIILDKISATAYIDDFILAHDTWEEHMDTLEKVLQRSREKKLSLKLKKCKFTSAKLAYLGHVVGSGQILPQEAKVEAITSFPKPENNSGLFWA